MLTDILKVETAKILERQLDKGNILRWGVSTYDYYEIDKIRDLGFKNIVLQINSNILDQRIENVSEQVRRDLKSKNIEIWARSIFLQGILINQTPENKFLKNSDIVNFFEKSNSFNFTPIELCLNYIKQNDFIDVAIIGILSNSQLEEISKILLQSNLILDYKSFQSFDLNLVDPRRWK
jgi:aryl-alcohol dehydrogenase-like predicted oxidoreductase